MTIVHTYKLILPNLHILFLLFLALLLHKWAVIPPILARHCHAYGAARYTYPLCWCHADTLTSGIAVCLKEVNLPYGINLRCVDNPVSSTL